MIIWTGQLLYGFSKPAQMIESISLPNPQFFYFRYKNNEGILVLDCLHKELFIERKAVTVRLMF